jgi:hypothetical protein
MRRLFLFVATIALLAPIGLAPSCGGAPNPNIGGGGQGDDAQGGGGDTGVQGMDGTMGDDGGSSKDGPQCVGLQCQALMDNCAAQGKPPTTLTGVVYDPAGALPLYNVYVYIPNATPDPIASGNPTCTSCQAPVSGSLLIGTPTLATGAFQLAQGPTDKWAVPSGDNIPLVLQIGKWRRQLTVPHIAPCTTTIIPDPTAPAQKLRLPAKSSEGDMPLIALTSGCDPAECFLRRIGIDDSEFVPPGSTTGHVHFYTGQDASNLATGNASAVDGGNTHAETYQWWTSSANLLKYDVIYNACECVSYDRGAAAYPAMHDYVSGGGRLLATHYYYNWFAPPTGPADFQTVVTWAPGGLQSVPPFFIDTSSPKGKAFGDWLQGNGVTQTYGQISLADTRQDMTTVTDKSSRWVYGATTPTNPIYNTTYTTFNAPVDQPVNMQCGRAAFSDFHAAGTSDDATFPAECANADPTGTHVVNQKALEFLFFDLMSCVQ